MLPLIWADWAVTNQFQDLLTTCPTFARLKQKSVQTSLFAAICCFYDPNSTYLIYIIFSYQSQYYTEAKYFSLFPRIGFYPQWRHGLLEVSFNQHSIIIRKLKKYTKGAFFFRKSDSFFKSHNLPKKIFQENYPELEILNSCP
jgi:hypothetical protein